MEENLTWEQMVEKYPDKWVAVKDPVFDNSTLLSGIVVAVLNDEEINEHMGNNFELNYYYKRTKDEMNIGVYYAT